MIEYRAKEFSFPLFLSFASKRARIEYISATLELSHLKTRAFEELLGTYLRIQPCSLTNVC